MLYIKWIKKIIYFSLYIILLGLINTNITNISKYFEFVVQNIVVDGCSKIQESEILEKAKINKGALIFQIPINNAKKNIEEIEWINNVIVRRQIPNTMNIKIVERDEIAIWINNKKKYLIDKDGKKIEHNDDRNDLILIIGEFANTEVNKILKMLDKYDIKEKISSMRYISRRRWDLYTKNGIIIKLPDFVNDEVFKKIKSFTKLEYYNQAISADFRIKNIIIIKTKPKEKIEENKETIKRK